MADLQLTFTIPDAYVSRLSSVIDYVWPGRMEQVPVPTKTAWLKYHMARNLKQQVLNAEQRLADIQEIEVL